MWRGHSRAGACRAHIAAQNPCAGPDCGGRARTQCIVCVCVCVCARARARACVRMGAPARASARARARCLEFAGFVAGCAIRAAVLMRGMGRTVPAPRDLAPRDLAPRDLAPLRGRAALGRAGTVPLCLTLFRCGRAMADGHVRPCARGAARVSHRSPRDPDGPWVAPCPCRAVKDTDMAASD